MSVFSPSVSRSSAIIIAVLALIALSFAACGNDDDDNNPTPNNPTGTATPQTTNTPEPSPPTEAPTEAPATPTPSLSDAEQQDGTQGTLRPAPAADGRCPVHGAICEFAAAVLPLLESGDIDGLIALAEPAPFTCPGDFLGPPPDICDGVADGGIAYGYVAISGGEGVVVDEAGFREWLQRSVDSIQNADSGNSDNYGDGHFQVAAVGCSSTQSVFRGICDGERLDLIYTHIDPDWPASNAQRVVTCVGAWRSDDGALHLTRIGCGVPPTTYLYDFEVPMGPDGAMHWYPWRIE